MFPETPSSLIEGVIEKVRDNLLLEMKKNQWPVTFSIGIGTFIKPYEDVDKMVIEVDNLMYEVKNSSKNNVKQKEYK